MNLNESQKLAVTEPPKNITVSAAAGSGKTQVLGARVLERISGENPVDVNRLLIVTFTRSAAAEMRSRISRSITDAMKTETDMDRRRNLERQLSLLGGADICTIDSFCYRLLKQNFFRVPGLPSDFSVGSEAQLRDIAGEALRDCVEMFSSALEESRGGELTAPYRRRAEELRRLTEGENTGLMLEGFARLSENYGSAKRTTDFITADRSRRKEDYIDFIKEIKRLLSSVPEPEDWLLELEKDYDPAVPFDETRLGSFAAQQAADILADIRKKLEDELDGDRLNSHNRDTFAATLENICELGSPETYSAARAVFIQSFPTGGTVQSKNADPHAAMVMDDVKNLWKKAMPLFGSTMEEIDLFREKMHPAVAALSGLTRLTLKLERQKMLEKRRLSFSACVSLALELLTDENGGPSETAMELRTYYDEIYVDEAQDIDPRQMALFEAISNGRLFMVGDVKQSIYGFRHAEPEIFNRRCAGGENSRLITMNINYRSNKMVINAVNQVFGRLMTPGVMNVDYDRDHAMTRGESWLPEASRSEFLALVDTEKSARTYKAELEAQAVANRIIELKDSGMTVYDKAAGQQRPVEYRDILVLFRANRDGLILERALSESGIPCYLDGGEGLYSKEEITAVLDVLRLIDNPLRDFPLAATLRGLMFGFGENDLLKIRAVSRKHSFSQVFAALSDPEEPRFEEYTERMNDSGLSERCLRVGGLLRKWRSAAAFRPVSDVISMILNDTGYYSSVGALPSGEGRRANLELLMDASANFEADGSRGLYSFIDYIDKQELSGGASDAEAKTLSDAMNVVRLMTIHKSKGLEAPVVVLFRCPSGFRASNDAFALSRELGFSADYIDEAAGYRYKSPLTPFISLGNRLKERTEEIRLLYVAMTRPRELMICTGYFPNEAAADRAFTRDTELTGSETAFLVDSYAKLLGASVTDERIWKLTTLAAENVKKPSLADRVRTAPALNEDVPDIVANLLGFSYNFAAAAAVPAKVSVSALRNAEADEDAVTADFAAVGAKSLRTPVFAGGEEAVTGAALGTAYHAVMENLDFAGPVTPQIDAMEKNGIISTAQRKLIMDERISALLDSPLGRRMKNAYRLWREAPFMINVPASEIEGIDAPEGETVAVQGIIDCFFEDSEGIVVVDYKTDRYSDPMEIARRYKKQIYYYTRAIKMKFSDKKIQKYLYLFHKGDIIEL